MSRLLLLTLALGALGGAPRADDTAVSADLYGDLVLSAEEARLDLRARPLLVWALLGEELDDDRLSELVVEAPVDSWQQLDELWLRVERPPYLPEGWTRVRLRVGDFSRDIDHLRATQLLTGVAARLASLEALRGTAAEASEPLGSAAAGTEDFAAAVGLLQEPWAQAPWAQAPWAQAPWVPTWGLGVMPALSFWAALDAYAFLGQARLDYWSLYADTLVAFGYGARGYGQGYGYAARYGYGHAGYTYGGLGHYHSRGLAFAGGFHDSYGYGAYDLPIYNDVSVFVIHDDWDDDHVCKPWCDEPACEEPDPDDPDGDGDGDGADVDPDDEDTPFGELIRRRLAETESSDRRRVPENDDLTPPTRTDPPGVTRSRRVGLTPESLAATVDRRTPGPLGPLGTPGTVVVSRTSERVGNTTPTVVRSSRRSLRSVPVARTPVVGRPSLYPPSHGGTVRTITPYGVVRSSASSSRTGGTLVTTSFPRSSTPSISSRSTPTYVPRTTSSSSSSRTSSRPSSRSTVTRSPSRTTTRSTPRVVPRSIPRPTPRSTPSPAPRPAPRPTATPSSRRSTPSSSSSRRSSSRPSSRSTSTVTRSSRPSSSSTGRSGSRRP